MRQRERCSPFQNLTMVALVPEGGWRGAGVSPGLPVYQTPAGQGFGSPAAPHMSPPQRGRVGVCAGRDAVCETKRSLP